MTLIDTRNSAGVLVCHRRDIMVERGVAALVDGGQVALFRLEDGTVLATNNVDPYSGAAVLSRGIVGSTVLADGTTVPTIASPLHKQVWNLLTGDVLETKGKEPRNIEAYRISLHQDEVRVHLEDVA